MSLFDESLITDAVTDFATDEVTFKGGEPVFFGDDAENNDWTTPALFNWSGKVYVDGAYRTALVITVPASEFVPETAQTVMLGEEPYRIISLEPISDGLTPKGWKVGLEK